jgi:excisionase family DNA binding protein
MGTDLLKLQELAARLRISPATVRRWMNEGIIPAIRLTPRTIRFDVDAVVDAIVTRSANRRSHDER